MPAAAPAASAAEKKQWPAVSTQSQCDYRPPDSEFLARFKAGKEYGKMNDQETHYREVVFTMWNINGVKYPAVFRP